MYPIWHSISSVILAILLFPFFGWQVLWIFVGGVCVDWDHYITHAIRFKKHSLKGTYNYFKSLKKRLKKGRKVKRVFLIFHTIEFIILVAFLSLYFRFILLIFIGLLLHLGVDIVEAIERRSWNRVISLFNWLRKPYF